MVTNINNSINKFKKFSALFSILILLMSFMNVSVIAQETTVTFGDPGTTMPGDFFHPIEILWEDLTGVSEQQQIEERYAEANTLIQDGDYENAGVALDEAAGSHEDLQTELETLAETTVGEIATTEEVSETSLQQEDSTLHNAIEEVVETEQTIQTLDNQLDAIHTELIADVQAGTLTEEVAGDIFNDVQAASAETETVVIEETEQVEEIISTETGVTPLEVELVINDVEEDKGLHEEYKEDVNHESLLALETAAVAIEEEIETLEATGEDITAAEQVLANAELHLDIADDALETGDIATAHEQFTEAEHLVANVDQFVEAPDANRDELVEILETTGSIESITEELKKEHPDYDDAEWERIIAEHPEDADLIKAEQETAEDINKLFSTTDLDKKTQELLAQGESEEEAYELILGALGNNFGEEYIPPGTYISEKPVEEGKTEVIGISNIETDESGNIIGAWYDGDPVPLTDIGAGGGFIYNHEYTDPTTGNTYEYKLESDGTTSIEYKDVLDQIYTEKLPTDYNPVLEYEKGNEEHTINYESPTGENVLVEFSALGFKVETTTGEKLVEDSYDPGKYAVAAGEEIKIDALGFTSENKEGKATVWTVNPELGGNIYYDTASGVIFNSEVSTHEEKTIYSDGKYVYTHAGDTYSYNPDTNKWTLPDGKIITTQVAPAPIGNEDKKEFITEHGETWKFEDGLWKAYKDDKVVEQYTPGVNNYYHYEPGETHTDPYTGATWTATTTEKGETVWKSSTGEIWNPTTGEHKDSSGTVVTTKSEDHYGYYKDYDTGKTQTYTHDSRAYYAETPDGSYNYVNPTSGSSTYSSSGTTWTYNSATGSWINSATGESHTESAGHADAYGHVGAYDSSYSGYSGGGDYSSYSGTYSGGYTGGYTGGHTGGGGGGGDSGGGGHSGHVIKGFGESLLTGKIIQDSRLYRRF